MADRQTMNVSLPPAQDEFVRQQVASGRYRSASEVVRDGLRLLEEAEQRRLLEKWLIEGLTDGEAAHLPPGLLDRAREKLRELIEEGVRSGEKQGWLDGKDAMRQLRRRGGRRKAS